MRHAQEPRNPPLSLDPLTALADHDAKGVDEARAQLCLPVHPPPLLVPLAPEGAKPLWAPLVRHSRGGVPRPRRVSASGKAITAVAPAAAASNTRARHRFTMWPRVFLLPSSTVVRVDYNCALFCCFVLFPARPPPPECGEKEANGVLVDTGTRGVMRGRKETLGFMTWPAQPRIWPFLPPSARAAWPRPCPPERGTRPSSACGQGRS